MEEAGISRTRRRLYRGHGPKDVGDLYEEHEVRAFLGEDRELLLAYLKRSRGFAGQAGLNTGGRTAPPREVPRGGTEESDEEEV